jgi:hypothetical protein
LPQAEGKVWEAIEQRLADVSRLQQENARLVERERRAVEAHASWYDTPAGMDENKSLRDEVARLKAGR